MLIKLINAIQHDSVEAVRLLLESGINPNDYEDQDKITPLHFTAQRNSQKASQIARLLLEAGANPLAKNFPEEETPIEVAIKGGCLNMTSVLQEGVSLKRTDD